MGEFQFDSKYIPDAKIGKILCCECGIAIEPNPSNCCIACIRSNNDIAEDIQKTATLQYCSSCSRYLDPPSNWVYAVLESKELLRLCMKRLKGLNQVKLVDAGFIWTEPHSKRIKMKIEVQKQILVGAAIQQSFIAEFIVAHQMCSECHRVEAKDYWNSLVQVRQRVDHKRTFYYLEQLILKHKMHDQSLGIKPMHGGLDFFFANDQGAHRLMDFLMSVVPCRWTMAKKLKSHDIHSNVYNYKRTFSVEIVPLCKDSIVCLPRKVAHRLGGINQLCIIHRVTNHVFLIDPSTAQMAEISGSDFWKTPFSTLCTSKKLVEFVVIDVEAASVRHFKGQGQISSKHQVGEVWVQKASELGSGDSFFCRSHLGHLLKPGDSVYGFDVKNSNLNDEEFDRIDPSNLPDVILVKKFYADKARRNRKRKWKLNHLGIDDDTTSQNRDYTDFLEDLEEDTQMRANVNIYRNEEKLARAYESQSEAGDEIPSVALEEMLQDLNIDDSPDEGEEGAQVAMTEH